MMPSVGGNVTAELQLKSTTKNAIGEAVETWETVNTLTGFLDYQSGESRYTNYDAKLQETTHVFVCDYVALDSRVVAENSRLIVNGNVYSILSIDNPMGLNYHFEIFLKFVGGQNGN